MLPQDFHVDSGTIITGEHLGLLGCQILKNFYARLRQEVVPRVKLGVRVVVLLKVDTADIVFNRLSLFEFKVFIVDSDLPRADKVYSSYLIPRPEVCFSGTL